LQPDRLYAPHRRSSLVDHVSFELMRRKVLRSALSLDRVFAREGFELVPSA
jgi:predicted nucleic acid-binding protein